MARTLGIWIQGFLPSTASPCSLSQKVCSKQMWPRIPSSFSSHSKPRIWFCPGRTSSQHLICLQSYTTGGGSGQVADRLQVPSLTQLLFSSGRLCPRCTRLKANPSLPILKLAQRILLERRKRATLWRGTAVPHPERLCIGKASALLAMDVQTPTLFGTRRRSHAGGIRHWTVVQRGTVLCDVGSNSEKVNQPGI